MWCACAISQFCTKHLSPWKLQKKVASKGVTSPSNVTILISLPRGLQCGGCIGSGLGLGWVCVVCLRVKWSAGHIKYIELPGEHRGAASRRSMWLEWSGEGIQLACRNTHRQETHSHLINRRLLRLTGHSHNHIIYFSYFQTDNPTGAHKQEQNTWKNPSVMVGWGNGSIIKTFPEFVTI